MWLPTPIYERIPQFWFLLGLLFFASGLLLGFEFVQAFYYLGLGMLCCVYGISIFLIRQMHRRGQHAVPATPVADGQAPTSVEPTPFPAE